MPLDLTEPCPACGSTLDVTGAPLFAARTCPVCGEQIHVHRYFDHYELLSVLGQGGQGTVFRAIDRNLDRQVALKVLRMEHGHDPEFVKLFEHEARLTASINHPNVVRVYSFGTSDGDVFLAMELVDGGTFDDQMEKLRRVPEARALQIGIQVAQGLKAGFEKGLIHRDVKPGNILFASDGSAKVVDFGLAVFHETQAAATGDIWGTPYYLSPERLNREQEDFRSDIYSLGAALFHAIAGRPPFEAEDASHVALKHLRTQAVSLQTFAPDVSNATAYVINRTLAKNPAERPASYDEFIEQLQYARDEAMASKRSGGKAAAKQRLVLEDEGDKKTMNRMTLALFAFLIIGLVVGGWLVVVQALRDDEDTSGSGAKLESFGTGWGPARELLLSGNWTGARDAFSALAGKSSSGSKQFDWAVIHQALAEQFATGGDAAAKALGQLPDASNPVRKFFVERIRPVLAKGDVIPVKDTAGFDLTNHEALGVLFCALHDYELGDVENAGPLFSQFTSLKPAPALAWLADYKQIAKRYQDEFIAYSLAADAWKNARNEREQAQALDALRSMPAKLPKDSKLLPNARKLIAEADKKVSSIRAERNKGNFAFKAKVRASGSNPNENPEKAVDGDPNSRWSTGANGEKWLAIDLGAPKAISRWGLVTPTNIDTKWGLNLSGFKLQRSDDGQAWSDVDTVTDNRTPVVDRVVAEFTARHVRILVTKEARNGGEKTARIQEIFLSAAADQARPTYEAPQNCTMRFSLNTPFFSNTIGDTGAFGNAQVAEADGKITVKGSGGDIWNNNDAFQFVWQPIAGNCEIVAKVVSVQGAGTQAKVGVMIRADLSRNASQGSMLFYGDKDLRFTSRIGTDKQTTEKNKPGVAFPRWFRLTRTGAEIVGYESTDGKQWNEVGREKLANIEGTAYVGLAVSSRARDKTATAVFSDVQIRKTNP